MPFNDLQTKQIVPVTLWSGDVPNVVQSTGGNVVATFKCPMTCELKRLQAAAQAITASSQFTVLLKRASAGTPVTLLTLTSAVPYTAGVVVDSGDVSIPLFKDEPLTLTVSGTDADTDDITALFVLASLQMRQEQDGA